jgi:ketosteroid isomerase-like protein
MGITRRHMVLAGAGALCTAALGLGSARAAQTGDDAAIAQAVEAFRNATLKADRSQFEALCADQLSYGHSAGRIETKSQFIDAATSGRSTWKFITLTDQANQVVGSNAIVRHILTGETERDGKTNPVKIGVLMVWNKQDGPWKLLARQAYKLE